MIGNKLISLYDLTSIESLFGFGIIIIWAMFHCSGKKWEKDKVVIIISDSMTIKNLCDISIYMYMHIHYLKFIKVSVYHPPKQR
jgi:hypothetical protein